MGGFYNFAGLAYDSGRLFVLNSAGLIRALDPVTGAQQWSRMLRGQWIFDSDPTAHAGVVYVNAGGFDGTLYAVRGSDGALLWTAPSRTGESAPAVDESGVYVNDGCHAIFAYTVAGEPKWATTPSCIGGGGRPPALHSGRLYAREDGKWTNAYDAGTGAFIAQYPGWLAPSLDGDTGYFVLNGALSAYDLATGALRWRSARGYVTAPILANGLLYLGDANGRVYALRAGTGALHWYYDTGTPLEVQEDYSSLLRNHSGLVVAAGRLFVPAGDRLTVLRTPVTTTAPATTTYGATVTVRVHAPARAAVSLYRRPAGVTTYSLWRSLTTDSYGWASTSYTATTDYRFYAVATGIASASVATSIRPTLSGPASALRGTTVRIGGTGVPGRLVALYFRRAGTTTYALRTKVTVNSYGRYVASYVADATYSYYAASGCCTSKVVTTVLSS